MVSIPGAQRDSFDSVGSYFPEREQGPRYAMVPCAFCAFSVSKSRWGRAPLMLANPSHNPQALCRKSQRNRAREKRSTLFPPAINVSQITTHWDDEEAKGSGARDTALPLAISRGRMSSFVTLSESAARRSLRQYSSLLNAQSLLPRQGRTTLTTLLHTLRSVHPPSRRRLCHNAHDVVWPVHK